MRYTQITVMIFSDLGQSRDVVRLLLAASALRDQLHPGRPHGAGFHSTPLLGRVLPDRDEVLPRRGHGRTGKLGGELPQIILQKRTSFILMVHGTEYQLLYSPTTT